MDPRAPNLTALYLDRGPLTGNFQRTVPIAVVGLIGGILNLIVLVIYYRWKPLQRAGQITLINLAIADCGNCFSVMADAVRYILINILDVDIATTVTTAAQCALHFSYIRCL